MPSLLSLFFFFNDTATTEIYTLSLHDALPICELWCVICNFPQVQNANDVGMTEGRQNSGFILHRRNRTRSEEHTSELQSRLHLVCRLLLEKKKKNKND